MKTNFLTAVLFGAITALTPIAGVAQETANEVTGLSEADLVFAQRIHNTYLQGRDAKEAGDIALAVRSFRAVLNVQPNHLRARRALVDILMELGEYEAAEVQVSELLKYDTNPEARVLYFRVQDEIVKNTPLDYSGNFSILPSTNVNNGTRIRYFSVGGLIFTNNAGYEESGYGLRLGGNASYRWSLGGGQQIQLLGDVLVNWYEIEALQNATGTLALQYQKDDGISHLAIGPYLRRTWYLPVENPDSRPDNYAVGVSLAYSRQITQDDKVSIDLRYEDQTHFALSRGVEYKSGPYQAVTVRWDHEIDSDLSVFGSVGLQAYTPPFDNLAYTAANLSIGANKFWSPTLLTGITLSVGERNYNAIYPGFGVVREDDFYSIEVSVVNAKIKIFNVVPRVSCTYRRNMSTIVVFYDYESTNCAISLVQSF